MLEDPADPRAQLEADPALRLRPAQRGRAGGHPAREDPGLKVMLGIWLDGKPGEAENARQIATGIRLANEYPDIVVAVSVGNEVLVSWSDHKMTEERGLEFVEQVKKAVRCPVTVADDYPLLAKPDAQAGGRRGFHHHAHAIPSGATRTSTRPCLRPSATSRACGAAHPGKTIVLGEAGWASYTRQPARSAGRRRDEAEALLRGAHGLGQGQWRDDSSGSRPSTSPGRGRAPRVTGASSPRAARPSRSCRPSTPT